MSEVRRDVLDVMRDDDERRRSRVGGEVIERFDELLPPGEIEPGRGLVEQHDRRLVHQRPGEQHPRPLARRERAEEMCRQPGDAHPLEAVDRSGIVVGAVSMPPRFERGVARRADDVERGERRPELIGHGRRDEADAAPQDADIGVTEVLAEHFDRPGRRMFVERGDPQQRRLAAAVRPEHEPTLRSCDVERDAVEDDRPVANEVDVAKAQRSIMIHGCPAWPAVDARGAVPWIVIELKHIG